MNITQVLQNIDMASSWQFYVKTTNIKSYDVGQLITIIRKEFQ